MGRGWQRYGSLLTIRVQIEGWYFSDMIDVRTYRAANIDSEHELAAEFRQPGVAILATWLSHHERHPSCQF